MNSFLTVVKFTLSNKLRAKSFVITTAIIALIISIGVNIPYVITLFQKDKIEPIGFIEGSAPAITVPLKAHFDSQDKAELKLIPFKDEGTLEANEAVLKQAIADKDIKGYLLFEEKEGSTFPSIVYKSESLLGFGKQGTLTAVLHQIKLEMALAGIDLSETQKDLLLAPVSIASIQISAGEGAGSIGSEGKTAEEQGLAIGLVYIVIIILFMGIMITGQLIASEITAEKSSRVMEILVTSVAPLKQMFGKIIGMLLLGLIQIGTFAVIIILNLSLPHNSKMLAELNINFNKLDPALIAYGVVFYLLGYFMYATMFAAVGSIVSRTEDLGQAVMPVTFLSLAGFYIGLFSITTPGTLLVKISSFVPFFSPFTMFMRIGLTDPPMWEVALSIGILLLTTLAFGWLSAKIYRTGVLMYGKRPSFKELRKAMKAYKI